MLRKLGAGSRLVIPAEYCRALGIVPGDDLVLVLEEGSLRVMSPREGIRRAQALVRTYIPEGQCLSEELIRERRGEAPGVSLDTPVLSG
jgi:bifunctional DNA-binding transcriptional regulator/antitoxin component of YhaV-PrlF toxin-antitoxin module